MVFEDASIGFSREKKVKKCTTLESSSPPRFDDNKVLITDSRSGANIGIEGNVESFKQDKKSGNYKIKICKK